MAKKSYLIIGLGEFGKSLVQTLSDAGAEIMVIDRYEDKLDEVSDLVTQAICANASDPDILEQIDVSQFDAAIVTTGNNLTVSILTTVQLKEMGVPYVVVKANNELEGKALTRVGADKVVFPEKEIGIRMANRLFYGNYLDAIELSEQYSIADVNPLQKWIGQTISDVGIRQKYRLNIVGIRKGKEFIINPGADYVIEGNDILAVLGDNEDIRKVKNLSVK